MEFKAYSKSWQSFNKVTSWVLIVLDGFLIGAMVRGKSGTESLYSRLDVPVYVYVISILVAIIAFIINMSLAGNIEGHKRLNVSKEHIKAYSIIGNSFVIDGPIKLIKIRFDLWADNDSENWVVELGNDNGQSRLALVPKNQFKDLENLLAQN